MTQPPLICTPTIRFHDLAGAMNFMWARYAFGQVVLDNDIKRRAWTKKDIDPDLVDTMTAMDRSMKDILRQVPANVITFSLLARFGPNKYACLMSKRDEFYEQVCVEVKLCFVRMQKHKLGRCLGAGRQLRFQKFHVDHLSDHAKDLVQNIWRLPLVIFGITKNPRCPTTVLCASRQAMVMP